MRALGTNKFSSRPSSTAVADPPTGSSAEWRALLELAAPHPNRDRLASFLPDSIHWTHFLDLAVDHGLIPLLAERVKSLDLPSIPPASRVRLQELQRSLTVSTLQLTAELFRVLHQFSISKIDVLITKGPALSVRCFGNPGLRQYSDLDLIIRETDIRRSTQAMMDLEYEPRVPLSAIDAKRGAGEYAFRKRDSDALVEFHTERTFRYHPRRLQIEKLFQRRTSVVIDGRQVPALSLEDELILICVHGAKHFWERLMWIADVAALVSAKQAPDWIRAITIAKEARPERMLFLGVRLASEILGAPLPEELDARVKTDRAVAKLANQIKNRLASPQSPDAGVLQRAIFRMRMRGGWFSGAAYLMRLSLAPTEEDWAKGQEFNRPAIIDAIGRSFRLG